MSFAILILIGAVMGVTTVFFGFGGGFVAVPVIAWADARFGGDAIRVAVASSALVMVVNAAIATATTPRSTLRKLHGRGALLALLALGAAVGGLGARTAPRVLVHWGFVSYLVVTILDLLLRPGFFHPAPATAATQAPLPTGLGLPIGALAAFLGVGGSVMTVPALRRAGLPMRTAATLANPLTLTIAVPAAAIAVIPVSGAAHVHGSDIVGLIDTASSLALLLGSLPVIAVLRRRHLQIPSRLHAPMYLALLAATTLAGIVAA